MPDVATVRVLFFSIFSQLVSVVAVSDELVEELQPAKMSREHSIESEITKLFFHFETSFLLIDNK